MPRQNKSGEVAAEENGVALLTAAAEDLLCDVSPLSRVSAHPSPAYSVDDILEATMRDFPDVPDERPPPDEIEMPPPDERPLSPSGTSMLSHPRLPAAEKGKGRKANTPSQRGVSVSRAKAGHSVTSRGMTAHFRTPASIDQTAVGLDQPRVSLSHGQTLSYDQTTPAQSMQAPSSPHSSAYRPGPSTRPANASAYRRVTDTGLSNRGHKRTRSGMSEASEHLSTRSRANTMQPMSAYETLVTRPESSIVYLGCMRVPPPPPSTSAPPSTTDRTRPSLASSFTRAVSQRSVWTTPAAQVAPGQSA